MERLNKGDIVKHFKYETLSVEDKMKNRYVYKILDFAKHTENDELLVIYQSLYTSDGINYIVYARPYNLFMGVVDQNKYPEIKQKYRFEKIGE